jgi:hypothetical protein
MAAVPELTKAGPGPTPTPHSPQKGRNGEASKDI